MKNLLVLSFLTATSFTGTMAQSGVILEKGYLPEKTYVESSRVVSVVEMNLTGDEKRLKELRDAGLKYPLKTDGVNEIETLVTTGKKGPKGIPVSIRYVRGNKVLEVNGEKRAMANPIVGAVAECYDDGTGRLHVDVINGLDEDQSELIDATKVQLEQTVRFPLNHMKPGNSFTYVMPMKLPTGGGPLTEILATSTYTLREIRDQTAFFDIVTKISLSDEVQSKMKPGDRVTGTGTGHAVFNIALRYFSLTETDVAMDIKMDMEGITMLVKTQTKTTESILIK